MTEEQEPEKTKGNKPKTKRHRKKSSKRKPETNLSPAEIKALKEHLLKDLPKSGLKNIKTWDIRKI